VSREFVVNGRDLNTPEEFSTWFDALRDYSKKLRDEKLSDEVIREKLVEWQKEYEVEDYL